MFADGHAARHDKHVATGRAPKAVPYGRPAVTGNAETDRLASGLGDKRSKHHGVRTDHLVRAGHIAGPHQFVAGAHDGDPGSPGDADPGCVHRSDQADLAWSKMAPRQTRSITLGKVEAALAYELSLPGRHLDGHS